MKTHHYIILIFAFCNLHVLVAKANPIALPNYTMTAENVLIGCSEKGIVVSGNYRFTITPDAKKMYGKKQPPLTISLPVPVPMTLKSAEELIAYVNPVLTLNEKEYRPRTEYHEAGAGINTEQRLVPNTNLAIFSFHIPGEELKNEVIVSIQYDQPIIEIDGKPCACYVPWISGMHKEPFNNEWFLISFEGYSGATLTLKDSTNHKVVQQKPALISVYAEHKTPIIVEIIPSAKSSGANKMEFHRGTEPDKSPPTVTSNMKENTDKPAVTMSIEYALTADKGIDDTQLTYTFTIILTNTSKEDITIPTRSYDGEPCCWISGGSLRGVTYSIGKWVVGGKVITPSPARFYPMVLHPGENAEFSVYKIRGIDRKEPLKNFEVYLSIDKDYAEMQNWWFGELHCKIDLAQQKPYKDDSLLKIMPPPTLDLPE